MEDRIQSIELILHKLNGIAETQETFSDRLEKIENKLNTINDHAFEIRTINNWRNTYESCASSTELKDLVSWKKEIGNIVSPPQLFDKLNDLASLKTFKTQALMIWVVVQAIVSFVLFFQHMKLFGN